MSKKPELTPPVSSAATGGSSYDYFSTYYQPSLHPSSVNASSLAVNTTAIQHIMLFVNDTSSNTITTTATIQKQHLCETEDNPWTQWERVTLLSCGLAGALAIAVLNLCVIITFIKCADIRVSAQNLYILNLALCDFCVGINSLPGVSIYFYNMCWPFGVPLCQLMTNMDWITSTETGISMCLIAYDRLRLVRLGALYNQLENRSVVVTKILVSWLIVIGFLMPGFLMPQYTGISVNEHGDCINEIYQIETLGTLLYTLTGSLPPLALVTIYTLVYKEMRSNSMRQNNERETRRQLRAARGMTFLCAIFLASWIPSTLHALLVEIVHNIPALQAIRLNDRIEFRVMTFFKFWIYLNSLVNPFLYAFAFPAIRNAMEKTFLPVKWHRQLESQRRLRRSTVDLGNDKTAAKGGSFRSVRSLTQHLTSKSLGNTLRRIVSREGSARSGNSSLNGSVLLHERSPLTAQLRASDAIQTETGGKLLSAPRLNGHVTSFGTTTAATEPEAAAAHRVLTNGSSRKSQKSDTLTLTTVIDGPTTVSNDAATTTSSSNAALPSASQQSSSSSNTSTTTEMHQHPRRSSSSCSLTLHVNPTNDEALPENVVEQCINNNNNDAAAASSSSKILLSGDERNMLSSQGGGNGEGMTIATSQGDLLLQTVVVNGYVTVML